MKAICWHGKQDVRVETVDDLRLAVNRVLARLYRSGEIVQVYERWFGPFEHTSNLLQAMYLLHSLPE
jgi:hypothetical protein